MYQDALETVGFTKRQHQKLCNAISDQDIIGLRIMKTAESILSKVKLSTSTDSEERVACEMAVVYSGYLWLKSIECKSMRE